MSFAELNVPKNHVYLFKPHTRRVEGNAPYCSPKASDLWYNNKTHEA